MGLIHIIDLVSDLYPYAGPGHWNDADMLEVGNGGMTTSEYRAHFSFWSLFASPLMAGNDVRTMTPEVSSILLNKDAIAVNQDPLGIQGRKVLDRGPYEVWMKPLADGSRAVIFFNRGSEAAPIRVTWEQLGLSANAPAQVRDLWAQKDRGELTGFLEMLVAPHDVRFMRITP
jgi:alpha-galactosidase